MRAETRFSLLLLGSTGLTAILSMAYSVLAVRLLPSADYADFAAAISLYALATLALNPIGPSLGRFAAEYRVRNELGKLRTLCRGLQRRILRYGLIGAVPALVVVVPVSSALRFQSPLPLVVMYAMVVFAILTAVPRGALRGTHEFGQFSLNQISEAVVRLVVGLALLWGLKDSSPALAAYAVAMLAAIALGEVQIRRIWGRRQPEPVDGRAVARFGLSMFVLMAVSAGYLNVDMLVVKRCFSSQETELYGATVTLARTVSVLVMPFYSLLLPMTTEARERGGSVRGPLLRICCYYAAVAAIPLAAFLFFGEELMMILYGEDFAAASPVLFRLAASYFVGHLSLLVCQAFAAGHGRRFLSVHVSGLVLMTAGLVAFHDTLLSVARLLLVVQSAVLAVLVGLAVVSEREATQNH